MGRDCKIERLLLEGLEIFRWLLSESFKIWREEEMDNRVRQANPREGGKGTGRWRLGVGLRLSFYWRWMGLWSLQLDWYLVNLLVELLLTGEKKACHLARIKRSHYQQLWTVATSPFSFLSWTSSSTHLSTSRIHRAARDHLLTLTQAW